MHKETGRQASMFGKQPRMSPLAACLAVAMLGGVASTASAVEIATGNPDLSIRWDNTLRYLVGVRAEGRDPRIANNPTADEGDFKFDKGQLVANRLDLFSEMDIVYKRDFGARISAAAWYDHAYRNDTVNTNPALNSPSSYIGNKYSSFTDRYYHGPSGELLDAFAFGNFDVAGMPVAVKTGRLSTYWGMALFYGGGIAYGQQPVDGRKAAANPGIEVKETFLPLTQLNVQTQVSDTVSLNAQYYLEWKETRIPEGGTYLGSTDFLLSGPQLGGSLPFVHGVDDKPGNSGNWGVNAKWTPEGFNGATIGLYYRGFDEKLFWLLRNPAAPLQYRAVYPQGTKLIGLSYDGTIGPYAVGAELAMRRNAGLQSIPLAAVAEGARGNTWHGDVNTTFSLPNAPLWDTGVVAAELNFEHLDKVTRNASLYRGEGTAACGTGNTRKDGCATRNAVGVALRIAPQYLGVFDGVDLTVPLTFSKGLRGNSSAFGGVNEGVFSWSLGIEADVRKSCIVSLRYADTYSPIAKVVNGVAASGQPGYTTNDRGWVSLTVKASF
ncbi:DUF1302 domain-containing protein [Massilia putida]|uniref:DUF1302 domain-containing protein n=1 Tax=Massilia putida TaxID=1141883 RepID=UPI0009F8A89D|nr:DUF1302 family protein [Massilia putida]